MAMGALIQALRATKRKPDPGNVNQAKVRKTSDKAANTTGAASRESPGRVNRRRLWDVDGRAAGDPLAARPELRKLRQRPCP